jgi:hypothetical protein
MVCVFVKVTGVRTNSVEVTVSVLFVMRVEVKVPVNVLVSHTPPWHMIVVVDVVWVVVSVTGSSPVEVVVVDVTPIALTVFVVVELPVEVSVEVAPKGCSCVVVVDPVVKLVEVIDDALVVVFVSVYVVRVCGGGGGVITL